MPADLHLHSHHSDGTCSPEDIVRRGASHQLDTLALTDHDTSNGWPEMEQHCQQAGIRWIPGIELSTEHAGQEIHLLAYFSSSNLNVLNGHLLLFQQRRRERVRLILERLKAHGVSWDVEQVCQSIDCKAPGRPHIARALVEYGIVDDMGKAFRKYLRKGKPGWVASSYPATAAMIQAVHEEGGLAVLAHPGLGVPNELVVDLSSQGLDGIEVFHNAHKPSLVKKYSYLSEKLDLIKTGGSDCHGNISGGPRIGKVSLPDDCLAILLARLGALRGCQQALSKVSN
ncbi:MAG: PHP domain-containing protein [Verrucomicrobiota bacterium]|nr:PHP domain-containing protein [Verrucomicrobiota bacterium]